MVPVVEASPLMVPPPGEPATGARVDPASRAARSRRRFSDADERVIATAA
jgi:hypothetical protein